jgi:hypothetical protein
VDDIPVQDRISLNSALPFNIKLLEDAHTKTVSTTSSTVQGAVLSYKVI